MTHLKCAGLAGLIMATTANVAFAQTGDPSPIVVTAQRLPGAASATITGLDANDLERRQTMFVADALTALPGVSLSQNGAFGGAASIRLRGAAPEQTLVLIDGVVVNDPSNAGGGYNFAFLDTASIARIEVLRGPQAVLWGSDAIGGVVHIVTRRRQSNHGAEGFAEAGSFGLVRGGLTLSVNRDKLDARASISAIETDGISKADARDGATERDPFAAHHIDARLGWDIAPQARIEAFGRVSESENHYDSTGGPTGARDGDEIGAVNEDLIGAVGRFNLFDGALSNIVQVSRMEIARRNHTDGALSYAADGRRDTLRYQAAWQASGHVTALFGAESEQNRSSGASGRFRAGIDGLFALVELEPHDTLTLTAGARHDDHSRFGAHDSTSFGMLWRPNTALTLHANWGDGFKAPTIFQLTTYFPPASTPNTALEPERAEGWDAGFTLAARGATLQASYFALRTDNLIQYLAGRYENIARAQSHGFEVSTAAPLAANLTLRAAYTYTDAINAQTGARLNRVPEHAAFLEFDWRPSPDLGLNLIARYNGDERDTIRPANPRGRIAAWTRYDLAARYALNDYAEIYARIENVADEHYQEAFGYGAPGRAAYAGVRVRLP